MIDNDTITAFQEWVESDQDKTGWEGRGWTLANGSEIPKGYTIEVILDRDKYGNPLVALFSKDGPNDLEGVRFGLDQ
jgi:hypothetical protein